MSPNVQLTNKSAFQEKSLGIQVALTVVTFGLYPAYWFYSTAKQFDQATNQSLSPILAFIPFANFLLWWQISEAAETVTDQSKELLFILFFIFGIPSWYWIQSGINDAASN
jgi:exosortase/archaeosortase